MEKFKNYDRCIAYLFSLERVGIKYDLNNIRKILGFLSHPERKFKSIHIAGTNGKGSVASLVNSVLMESGYKTGLYTSPHIKDFRERILVNGKEISRNYVIDFTNRLYKLFEEIKPSFFEAGTAMVFEYFANQKVDYAIIEAGLGGRLDSTNVITPIVSVITGISIDHTEYLGDTIEQIAVEKAGIIKNIVPCVIGKTDNKAEKIIKKVCEEKKSELIDSDRCWNVNIVCKSEDSMDLRIANKHNRKNGILLNYPVVGDYQLGNVKTALAVLDVVGKSEGITFKGEDITKGFRNMRKNSNFYGRFQKINENPKVVIDISHNLQGIKNIKKNLKYFKYGKLYILFGMMKDKEYIKCIRELEKLDAIVILSKPEYKRAEEPEILFKSAKNKEKFLIAESIKAAYSSAIKLAGKRDLILITGSFFMISDFLKLQKVSPLKY